MLLIAILEIELSILLMMLCFIRMRRDQNKKYKLGVALCAASIATAAFGIFSGMRLLLTISG